MVFCVVRALGLSFCRHPDTSVLGARILACPGSLLVCYMHNFAKIFFCSLSVGLTIGFKL